MSLWRELVALSKPRITTMVVLTAGTGLYLAPLRVSTAQTLMLLLGSVCIVSGANALNMYIERDIDGRAQRTRSRPLPAGRLAPRAALWFGVLMALLALPLLTLGVNWVTGGLGLLSFLIYVGVYTPMKQWSPGALVIGAIPGAIPPLMGWTAATGELDPGGLVLFIIMFLWQLPHFLAITLYRLGEYKRAGYKVTASDYGIETAKVQIVLYLAALCPVTLLMVPLKVAGSFYLWTALLSGTVFFLVGLYGLRPASGPRWAKALFSTSLLYLTVLFGALIVGR